MSERNGAVSALGESALTGWRGAVGKAVARPVAKRTRFSEEDIRVAIGLAILAYTLYRILRPAIRALRESSR
jgi:copper oxidase (laccase) domain-containing protein